MLELGRFALSDMVRCSTGVREAAAGAPSMESAAQAIVSYLHENLVDKELDQLACALVRLYAVHPYDLLDDDLKDAVRSTSGERRSWRGVPCLTLLGTAGDEPAWNDRRRSAAHRAIPLESAEAVERLPMIAGLVHQFGLDVQDVVAPQADHFRALDRRSYDVFFVPDAVGSAFVPDQDRFVLRHGVRSVLGFGGVLPSGSLFAVILFSRTGFNRETADLFRSVALSVKLALLPFAAGPVFDADIAGHGGSSPAADQANLQSRAAVAEQLVDVWGGAVLSQALRLESALEDAERRAGELALSQHALSGSEARLRAMVDGSLDAIVGMDAHGLVTEFNPAAEAMFGWQRSDVLGLPLAELIIPASLRARHTRGLEEYKRTGVGPILGRRVELMGMRREGDEFPVELAVAAVDDGDALSFTGFIRDITARRASEEALRASQQRASRIARTLQESLLPPALPELAGLELASRYHPAGDGSEVGGDFYDVFQTGREDWGLVLGDVCGKGVEAAAVTALARYTVRAAAIRSRKPTSILAVLNAAVQTQYADSFCTVVYGRLRRKSAKWRLTVASGGHPPCLVVRPSGEVEELASAGIIVGQFPDAQFAEASIDLAPGESAVFYTDGVSEARGPGRTFFGEERLKQLLRGLAGAGAATVADAVESAVVDFQDGVASDDIAVLVVHHPVETEAVPAGA